MKQPYRPKYFFQAILTGAIVAFVSTTSFAGTPKTATQSPTAAQRRFQGKSQSLLNTSAIRGRKLSISSNGQGRRSVLSPASMLDTTFNHTGTVTTAISAGISASAQSVAIQSNGKIVAGGSLYTGLGYAFALVRYDCDGTPDNTFGTGGIDTTVISTGGDDEVHSVVIQSNGKIVAAGYSNNGSATTFALARYDTDGTLDTTFNHTGKVTTVIGTGGEDYAYSVAIQADGKIVAAGKTYNGSAYLFALARYNTDGTLDTTFNHTGMVTTAIGAMDDEAASVAIQPDGKIVAAGSSSDGLADLFALARYDTNGTLDNTFGTGGTVTMAVVTGCYAYAGGVAIQSDGKIVAAGASQDGSGNFDFALARYNADGTLDNTFGTGGIDTTVIGTGGNDRASSVAIQSDGKIVAAGYSYSNSIYVFALARYDTDGTLDNTFGTGGIDTTIIGTGGDDEANSVAIQSDGRIVAAGYSSNGSYDVFALARYLGPSDISLAVQATDFLANSDAGSVKLSWKTQSEVNNAGFNVLREETSDLGIVTSAYQVIASYKNDKSLDGLGTSSTGQAYEFTDNKVQSGASYNYEIQSVSTNGTTKDVSTLSVTVGVPKTYALYQNYPNPFNPSTTVRFDLKEQSNVTLTIYNVLGQEVEHWNYGMMNAGRYNKDVDMARFASGVYFYRIVAQGQNGERFVWIKKMVELK